MRLGEIDGCLQVNERAKIKETMLKTGLRFSKKYDDLCLCNGICP